MRQLKPRLIASISNSHLQDRLSDVHVRSPVPHHNFWRWSRCLRVTCGYQSQVLLLLTVMLAAQVFHWDTWKPREEQLCCICLCMWGCGQRAGIQEDSGQLRKGPELPLEVGLGGGVTAVRTRWVCFANWWLFGWR